MYQDVSDYGVEVKNRQFASLIGPAPFTHERSEQDEYVADPFHLPIGFVRDDGSTTFTYDEYVATPQLVNAVINRVRNNDAYTLKRGKGWRIYANPNRKQVILSTWITGTTKRGRFWTVNTRYDESTNRYNASCHCGKSSSTDDRLSFASGIIAHLEHHALSVS